MKTVLLVDDDREMIKSLRLALGEKGYDVIATTDPAEAGRMLEERTPNLVMLDVRMPKKSGFEIFREIKKQCGQIPVLFITAYPRSFSMTSERRVEMWKKEFADGNTDIIYKPFKPDTLYEKIESLIGAARKGAN